MKSLLLIMSVLFAVSCVQNTKSTVTTGGSSVSYKQYYACANSGAISYGELYTFYNNNKYTLEMIHYRANDCDETTEYEQNFFQGEYTYDATTRVLTDRPLKLLIAFSTQDEVNTQNAANQCGYSNWILNTVKDVTNNELCQGGTIYSDLEPIIQNNVTLNDSKLVLFPGGIEHIRVTQ